jgi:hypothetical protein
MVPVAIGPILDESVASLRLALALEPDGEGPRVIRAVIELIEAFRAVGHDKDALLVWVAFDCILGRHQDAALNALIAAVPRIKADVNLFANHQFGGFEDN